RSDRFAIKDSVFFEMPIPLPSLDEQRKLGAFFLNLDNLITLHQRKCDTLKKAKKFFLQNMLV
ncbi:MAG: restriction endonuclease subunit S, partial [Succinivibrionaceae bacterium]|nr:restriction endonuclease subunit S [Succinivibrionaceae bacterium]